MSDKQLDTLCNVCAQIFVYGLTIVGILLDVLGFVKH